MRTRSFLLLVGLGVFAAGVPAAVIGASAAAPSLTEARIAQLPRAQQAAWREYLARSTRQDAADRAFFRDEMKTAGIAADSLPPNGSAARSIPLNKPPEWYSTAEARRAADIVLSFQTPAGGWSKNLNVSDHARRPGERFAPNNLSAHLSPGDFDTPHDTNWNYVGTLDNDATTTELQFLAKVAAASPAAAGAYRAAFLRGLDYLFHAQFPNGGWPQVWPLEGGYHDAITFNDGALTQTIALLQQAAEGKDAFAFVPEKIRQQARASVARALDCILATQIVVDGRRTVWAQQHDALTLKPVAGRNYEPAALSAAAKAPRWCNS